MSSKSKGKFVPTRKKVVLPLKVKIEMLDRLRVGESFASVARYFNVNESTVRFIKKSEDKIRNSIASSSLSVKTVRDPAIEKMEAALSLWIDDCFQKRMPLNGRIIRDKAKNLYVHFKGPSDVDEEQKRFQASVGWYHRFKERQSIHSIKIAEEAVSADTAASKIYPTEFLNLIAEEPIEEKISLNKEELIDKSTSNELVKDASYSTDNKSAENFFKVKKGLDLANELELYFTDNDPLKVRSAKFKQELQKCLAPYKDLLKELENKSTLKHL